MHRLIIQRESKTPHSFSFFLAHKIAVGETIHSRKKTDYIAFTGNGMMQNALVFWRSPARQDLNVKKVQALGREWVRMQNDAEKERSLVSGYGTCQEIA
jgi:hypothetical protein